MVIKEWQFYQSYNIHGIIIVIDRGLIMINVNVNDRNMITILIDMFRILWMDLLI